ncbi:hypothetical protein [Streptomyces collinus]
MRTGSLATYASDIDRAGTAQHGRRRADITALADWLRPVVHRP